MSTIKDKAQSTGEESAANQSHRRAGTESS